MVDKEIHLYNILEMTLLLVCALMLILELSIELRRWNLNMILCWIFELRRYTPLKKFLVMGVPHLIGHQPCSILHVMMTTFMEFIVLSVLMLGLSLIFFMTDWMCLKLLSQMALSFLPLSFLYEKMSLEDNLLLELHSIGLIPETLWYDFYLLQEMMFIKIIILFFH